MSVFLYWEADKDSSSRRQSLAEFLIQKHRRFRRCFLKSYKNVNEERELYQQTRCLEFRCQQFLDSSYHEIWAY